MKLPRDSRVGAGPDDELEKAIFDLQDVKNTYLNEQKDFEVKQLNFKTQDGFFKNYGSANKSQSP